MSGEPPQRVHAFDHLKAWAIVAAVDGWSPWPRLAMLVAAGLTGGVGVVWGARRILGAERARRWVGA